MTHTAVRVITTLADLNRADRTDGQLLDLFVRKRDHAAFESLVRRHGPMVLGVCRRVLRNHADADDAFQAAFLVLARKAATLGTRELLAGFLHSVAFNTARKLRRANVRRAGREKPLAGVAEPSAAGPDQARAELLALLDEELSRLPDRYRTPLVLCDLQGVTRREAAVRLGWPEGTVAGRLARARAMLAERLAARGVAPAAGVVVAVLAEPAAASTRLVGSVTAAVSGGAISSRVAELCEGVMSAMFAKKLRAVAAVVLFAGIVFAGVYHASAGADPADPRDKNPAPPPPAPEVKVSGKVLTVLPLRKLDPASTAELLNLSYTNAGVIVAPLPEEKALLVYADAKVTRDIEALLHDLGERPKKASVIRLKKDTDCKAAARTLTEAFGKERVAVVPVPDENVLLVYATETDTLTVRKLLGAAVLPTPAGEVANPAPDPKRYAVNFRNAPWDDVLDWYAKESGLTPIYSVKPVGTVTIAPPKDRLFTLAEITDLINEAMIQQQFILIRRQVTFTILPADEKLDSTRLPRIELSDLKHRGKTELVQVLIHLKALRAEDIAPEVQKMLTPFGSVSVLAKMNTLVVVDTAGNINRIVGTLDLVAEGLKEPKAGPQDPRHDPRGYPAVPPPEPELRKYSVPPGNAAEIAKAVQTSYPSVRVIALPSSNEIMVLATPAEHLLVAAKLRDLGTGTGKKEPEKK